MPGSTPRGYPFPLGTEPAEGNDHIEALARSIDTDVAKMLPKAGGTVPGPVNVFASAAERDAAIPAPVEGVRIFRSDLNREQVYSGTAWRDAWGLVPSTVSQTLRYGIGHWQGTLTTNASGVTNAVDLSQGGWFTGSYMFAYVNRASVSQTAPYVATVTAAQFTLYGPTGTPVASQTLTSSNVIFIAQLGY